MGRLPRYLEVAATLEARIADGTHAVGTLLPTESELQRSFSVSRFTVREALRKLTQDGLIQRRQGSGTLVASTQKRGRFQQVVGSVDDLLQYAHDSSFLFSFAGPVQADPELASILDCSLGEPWLKLTGLRRVPGLSRPLCQSDVYLRPRFAPLLPQITSTHQPVFEQLERLGGVPVGRIVQEFRAVALTAAEARRLECDRITPTLLIVRRYFEPGGRTPYQVSASIHPGDLFTYAVTLETRAEAPAP
jgi:DNA-binding GntR family transcriptional regulator